MSALLARHAPGGNNLRALGQAALDGPRRARAAWWCPTPVVAIPQISERSNAKPSRCRVVDRSPSRRARRNKNCVLRLTR